MRQQKIIMKKLKISTQIVAMHKKMLSLPIRMKVGGFENNIIGIMNIKINVNGLLKTSLGCLA